MVIPPGVGSLHRYDAVGSVERVQACCAGRGEKMIQPILDEVTSMESDSALWDMAGGDCFESSSERLFLDMSVEEASQLVLRAFKAAAEREISLGDGVDIWILSSDHKNKGCGGNHKYLLSKSFHALPKH
jgi:20S proteasome alpha/beta subunit